MDVAAEVLALYNAGSAGKSVRPPVSVTQSQQTIAENGGTVTIVAQRTTPDDVDVCQLYDAFTSMVLLTLEGLGFCKKGEGGPFVEDGKLRVGGALPTNTDGGGLSSCHPGMRGMFLMGEAVKHLRGEAGERQVPDARVACVNGTGGWFSSASTLLLGAE